MIQPMRPRHAVLAFARHVLVAVALAAGAAAEADPIEEQVPEGHMRASDCMAWVEETYRVDELSREFGLDLADGYSTALACVEHDTSRMQPVFPIRWCDNVFKIHCSTLDLLAEIAEAEAVRCERLLGESLGIDASRHRAWKTCARDVVFDRYASEGRSSDEAACRGALLRECGTNIEPRATSPELSSDSRAFVECCSAETLDPDRRSSDRCGMIDDGFTRGPCLDYPVCVNRLSGEWLSCSG